MAILFHLRAVLCACVGLSVQMSADAWAASNPTLDPVSQLKAEVRQKGWIAYGARSSAGDWDLFVCRPDGSDIRPLTTTPEFSEFSPQWSRDGRKLLYRRMPRAEVLDNNRHGEQGELVLANADGSSPEVLGKAGELPWASFSPDGTQIASLSIKGIAFVELSTKRVLRSFPRKGFFQQVTWSPDGKWLIGVANSFGASWSIARMDAATGEATAVNRIDCCTPDWFPDSVNVIFSWRPPGQKVNNNYGWTELWRASADGASRELVYGEEGRHVYGGHVSPDGRYVLFTGNMNEDGDPKNAGGPMGLMRLQDGPIIVGASQELRSRHPNSKAGPVLELPKGWEPCWTFAQVMGSGHESGTPAQAATISTAPQPDWSDLHYQGWIAYSAKTDAGDWDLFLMRPDGTDRRRMTSTPEFNEGGARFSPDGSQLLFYRMPKSEPLDNNSYGTFELVIARADGANARSYGKDYQWASWGPDGRQIACLSSKGIDLVDLGSRTVTKHLARHGIVEQLVWSPDGKRFVGTANGLGPYWNIGVLNPDSDTIQAVSETERYNCTPDWLPDAQRIVYARGIVPQKGGCAELWVADVEGKHRRRIYAEPGRHIYGACPSPDGKCVLFTRSIEDLGQVKDTVMATIRWPEAGAPIDTPAPRLDLGPGWEPHWTARDVNSLPAQ